MVDDTGQVVGFEQANTVQRCLRLVAGTRPMAWLFARVLHHLDGPVLRRSGGRRSVSSALTGLPIVELRTVGARSGEPRTLPMVGVPDGDRLVLVASNYGQQRNPGWYYNLKTNSRCSVVFRGRRYEMEAYEADGEERERLWELDVSVYPPRNQYARRAGSSCVPAIWSSSRVRDRRTCPTTCGYFATPGWWTPNQLPADDDPGVHRSQQRLRARHSRRHRGVRGHLRTGAGRRCRTPDRGPGAPRPGLCRPLAAPSSVLANQNRSRRRTVTESREVDGERVIPQEGGFYRGWPCLNRAGLPQ